MGLKINLGSGRKRIDGFLNVDGDINLSPDYLVDLEKDKLPFEDSSVSEIMINGPFEIFVEKKGLVYRVPNRFSSRPFDWWEDAWCAHSIFVFDIKLFLKSAIVTHI